MRSLKHEGSAGTDERKKLEDNVAGKTELVSTRVRVNRSLVISDSAHKLRV